MERVSKKKLPPIFKMSVLWNILPYYGNLHRWRRLLEKINTETKDIWDQNREQLMYIGRDFKRDIELDCLNKYPRYLIPNISYLRPNRSWLDLFSLSLSNNFNINNFDITILIDNLSKDEVIILDSHDDIFKEYQIHFWRKDSISDILPAIECPSFKSGTKIFKTSEKKEMNKFIDNQDHIKSIVIEKTDEELSINLVYGNTIKIGPRTFLSFEKTKFFDKLKKRYKLWKIDDCACKPKKIRIWEYNCLFLKNDIEEHVRISNINDIKVGIYDWCEDRSEFYSNCKTMDFNHLSRWINDKNSNFMFLGETLTVVYKGNSFDFRLDQRTKESKNSWISGWI